MNIQDFSGKRVHMVGIGGSSMILRSILEYATAPSA